MVVGITILVILMVAAILIESGKPKELQLEIEPFLDSYEYQDFDKAGRIKYDYFSWKGESVVLPVRGHLDFGPVFFHWGRFQPISMIFRIKECVVPDGFECVLKQRDAINEYPLNYPMPVRKQTGKEDRFHFLFILKKVDIQTELTDPFQVNLDIEGVIDDSRFLFFKTSRSCRLTYNFFIGPELGNVWVAFDPGTTGSCIVSGSSSHQEELAMEYEGKNKKITPSVLIFHKELRPESVWQESENGRRKVHPDLYDTGFPAFAKMTLERNIAFGSIKKLLGFVDKKKIEFANGNILELKGAELSALLVDDLFQEYRRYVESQPVKYKDLLQAGRFNPKRAVVAVPNNFTAVKIIDMISCLQFLEQFIEIRYVTEAEAILCYYIFNRDKLNTRFADRELDETILVFDMGGATINATVADVVEKTNEGNILYEIDIDAQIGYGIGGDTIDYCLARTIFSGEEEYPVLRKHNPFGDLKLSGEEAQLFRKKVQQIMFELKKTIIDRFYHSPLIVKTPGSTGGKKLDTIDDVIEASLNPNYQAGEYRVLLTRAELEEIIQQITGEEITIKEDSILYRQFRGSGFGEFYLFSNPFFKKLVYDPIKDAVTDVSRLSEGEGGFIDTIIFSGRSCLFPLIKETVLKVVMQIEDVMNPGKKIAPVVVGSLGPEELKTAVVEGACLYGVHKEAIQLNPQKVNSAFGIKRTNSATKEDFQFIELIPIGTPFSNGQLESAIIREMNFSDSFLFDGNTVNFYQIMGRDGYQILRDGHKHKYAKVASIPLDIRAQRIGTKISKNDFIECYVHMTNNEKIAHHNTLADQEIADANDEHYTWIVT